MSRFEDPSDLRKMPEHHHNRLKRVQIINFTSAKSLVELTCHILESTTSFGVPRCSLNKFGKCLSIRKDALMKAYRALETVRNFHQAQSSLCS
jgi:hypothetical protein